MFCVKFRKSGHPNLDRITRRYCSLLVHSLQSRSGSYPTAGALCSLLKHCFFVYFNSDEHFQETMSSTTKKHGDFVGEPMGNKPVTHLPGIGRVRGQELGNKGFTKAKEVYGQYLVMHQDRDKFVSWLRNNSYATQRDAQNCYTALKDYSDQHL